MYYIDSLTYCVAALDYDLDSGNITNQGIVYDFKANNTEGILQHFIENRYTVLVVAIISYKSCFLKKLLGMAEHGKNAGGAALFSM
jgi:hypothetical protein